jgi:hypothetical protein
MIDATLLKAAGVAVVALVTGVGAVYSQFTPRSDFYRHVADARTGTVLELVSRAQSADGDYKDTLCRALIETLNEVCNDSPQHPLCVDRDAYRKQAGC